MADITLPNITAQDEASQLIELKNYLYQMVEQINFAFNAIEKAENGDASNIVISGSNPIAEKDNEALRNFNEIKSLIVKSGEVVTALYDQVETRLSSIYVAKSDFGTYTDAQGQVITVTAADLKQSLQRLEIITDTLGNVTDTMVTNANIRSGIIDEDPQTGIPVIGIELGQRTERDGEEVFNKYARFTSDGVYFYVGSNEKATAYMTGQTLYITEAHIIDSMYLGGYYLDLTNGIAFRWAGGE